MFAYFSFVMVHKDATVGSSEATKSGTVKLSIVKK